MTPQEYLQIQETNRKVYELARNQEEKNRFLANMMKTEVEFMEKNIPQIEAQEVISGQPLNFNISPNTKNKSVLSSEDPELYMVRCEKVTPENVFEKLSAQTPDGQPVDLKKLFEEHPELVQKLCDLVNSKIKKDLEKELGNTENLQLYGDDNYIGFKRSPESIKNPDIEVNNIVKRAQNLADSQVQKKLEEPSKDALKTEVDVVQQRLA